jgi:hypothetical protein
MITINEAYGEKLAKHVADFMPLAVCADFRFLQVDDSFAQPVEKHPYGQMGEQFQHMRNT